MKEINIFLEKLMFLAIIGIPIGIFMIAVQSDGRFSFAALATLVVTAVMILSFSILSPLLEIAANTREIAENSRKQSFRNGLQSNAPESELPLHKRVNLNSDKPLVNCPSCRSTMAPIDGKCKFCQEPINEAILQSKNKDAMKFNLDNISPSNIG